MQFELEEELIEILKRDGKKLCMHILHEPLSDFESFALSSQCMKTVDDIVYEQYSYRPSLVVDRTLGFMADATETDAFYLGVNIVVRASAQELE